MQGDEEMVRVVGEYTDIVVVDEHGISMHPNKRLIAIVHEDKEISLSKNIPYQTSPGCYSTYFYSEGAIARKPMFVLGTPVTQSEMDYLVERNKDLEAKNATADKRVDEAIASFEKRVKELTESVHKENELKQSALASLSIAKTNNAKEVDRRKKAEEAAEAAQKALKDYKEKVSQVMLLIPSRGECSVADLVESADVAEVIGGEKE